MKNREYMERVYKGKPEWEVSSKGGHVRHAALTHEALGTSRTKVLFHDIDGNEYAYWMNQETYNAIPLFTPSTPGDYAKHGEVNPTTNTDIYNVT